MIIDSREFELRQRLPFAKTLQLDIGDIIVGDIIIERKSFPDLIKSIYDGRFDEQLDRIATSGSGILLLELDGTCVFKNKIWKIAKGSGNVLIAGAYDTDANAVFNRINSRVFNGLKLLLSTGIDHTVKILQNLQEGMQNESRDITPHAPKVHSHHDILRNILMAFPGIGQKTANEIISSFAGQEATPLEIITYAMSLPSKGDAIRNVLLKKLKW